MFEFNRPVKTKRRILSVKTRIKLVILLVIVSIFLIFNSGCNYIAPDPNVNYDNYTISYIKVFPSTATMNVNDSKSFEVKAYDSEDNLIPIDVSQVDWVGSYECIACGIVWKLNPGSGSTSTYFTPEEEGEYNLYAHYKEKWGHSTINAVK